RQTTQIVFGRSWRIRIATNGLKVEAKAARSACQLLFGQANQRQTRRPKTTFGTNLAQGALLLLSATRYLVIGKLEYAKEVFHFRLPDLNRVIGFLPAR